MLQKGAGCLLSATPSRPGLRSAQRNSPRSSNKIWSRTAPGKGLMASNEDPVTVTEAVPVAQNLSAWQRAIAGSDKLDWSAFLGSLAAFGALNGTFLDGIHSKDGLQVYDWCAITLGGLSTSAAVPPLLALFYLVAGLMVPLSDNLIKDNATLKAQARSSDIAWVALSFGILAAELQLSAWAYSTGMEFQDISIILGIVTCLGWALLDGTKQGVLLAIVTALGAPAAELVLLQIFPLWHYPRGDMLDGAFVSWVPWCYAFYIPALSSLARYLWYTTSLPLMDNFGQGRPQK